MSLKDREEARSRRMEPDYQPQKSSRFKWWVFIVIVALSAVFVWYTWPH
jgi:cytoskeletal protein RodZ